MADVTLEQVQALHDMMTGRWIPSNIHIDYQPGLSPEAAMSVIWWLQEETQIVPDHFELCSVCGTLYDSHAEGYYYEDSAKYFCDCTPAGYGPQDIEEEQRKDGAKDVRN